jgi:heme oxygenase (biliverdin-IX-beta and delta-forming)
MVALRLKNETKPNHDSVERLAHSDKIMDHTLSLDQYRDLIISQYLLHRHLEDQMAKVLSAEQQAALEFEQRRKLPLLALDLALVAPEGLAEEAADLLDTFRLASAHDALGAMYVLEGSTLGGAVIRRELAKNPHLADQVAGFHYYGCYGPLIGERWKSFQGLLAEWATSPEQQDAVVQKAKETFGLFERLLARQQAVAA